MSRYGLAIHTASSELGLAINDFSGSSRCQVWELGRATSNLLHHYLMEFLAPQTWQDLAFIAVAQGPGGFTGTRIGVVTARTLGQQLNLPVFAISTLAAVAWDWAKQLDPRDGTVDLAVQMPAQRGDLFGAIYQWGPRSEQNRQSQSGERSPSFPEFKVLHQDSVMTPEQWQQVLDQRQNPYQRVAIAGGLGGTVSSLLDLAYLQWQGGIRPDWAEALPFYGQHPVVGG
jgi:tRNA threonylcarbamoyl adenosine modification protein YeaZ